MKKTLAILFLFMSIFYLKAQDEKLSENNTILLNPINPNHIESIAVAPSMATTNYFINGMITN